jgi:hypothetical protein
MHINNLVKKETLTEGDPMQTANKQSIYINKKQITKQKVQYHADHPRGISLFDSQSPVTPPPTSTSPPQPLSSPRDRHRRSKPRSPSQEKRPSLSPTHCRPRPSSRRRDSSSPRPPLVSTPQPDLPPAVLSKRSAAASGLVLVRVALGSVGVWMAEEVVLRWNSGAVGDDDVAARRAEEAGESDQFLGADRGDCGVGDCFTQGFWAGCFRGPIRLGSWD